jgi:hypothetical protein
VSAKRAAPRVGALPPRRRRLVKWLAIGTWLTGAVWVYFKYFVTVTDSFGFEGPHPAQRWVLIAHAGVSFGALWMYGVLWPGHVVRGWKSHVRRWSGGTLWGVTLWLVLTGFLLYYLGSDSLRSWTSLLHWTVGLAALAAYLVHRRKGAAAKPQGAGGVEASRRRVTE